MNIKEEELLKWDADHLMGGFKITGKNIGIIVERADGITLYDTEGKGYIDGGSQMVCVSLGYKYKDEIAAAAAEQMRKLPYMMNFWGFTHPAMIECGQKLAELTPEGLDHFYFTNGGSESTELSFQLARKYWKNKETNKYKIISLYNSYHGMTYGAITATGVARGALSSGFAPLVPGFVKAPSYYCYRCMLGLNYPECGVECAKQVEKLIYLEGADNVAALIVEPLLGAAGHIPPPPEYWPMIRDICTKHDVLLIADEIMTGFGRTGKAFGLYHWGIEPDMMTLAKGMTSAYMPFGAVVMNDMVYDAFKGSVFAGATYSGHPVAAAVCSKVMEIYVRDKIFENAADMGKYAMERLKHQFLPLPCVGEVSGLGLMIGIEIAEDKVNKKGFDPALRVMPSIQRKALENGLYVRVSEENVTSANRISFCPPLIATKEEIDKILDILYPIVADLKPTK